MRDDALPVHRSSKPAGAVVLAFLAGWLCLLPLVEAAHFAFADHDHIFCLEHHRIEDIPRRAAPFAPTGDPGWVTNRPAAEQWRHNPCSILAVVVAPGTMDAYQPRSDRVAADEETRFALADRRQHIRSRWLLLDAPKTSPPLA
jgi:hypothetical protein